ncbi:unnamed protein product, partial [Prorocentrum cordatum]
GPAPLVVFVLGHSVACDYAPGLRAALAPCGAAVARKNEGGRYMDNGLKGANGGSSRDVLAWLRHALALPRGAPPACAAAWPRRGLPARVDLLLLNCGLWDVRRPRGEEGLHVPPEDRVRGQRGRDPGAGAREAAQPSGRLAWVASTPVDDDLHNAVSKTFRRLDEDPTWPSTTRPRCGCARRGPFRCWTSTPSRGGCGPRAGSMPR